MNSKHATGREDIVEPPQSPAGESVSGKVQELTAALQQAQEQAAQNRDSYLRAAAELDNVRKRSERDLENAHKYALERFLQELLPVKDSLEAGITAAGNAAGSLKEGLDMTLKMLTSVLDRFGVNEVNPPKGAAFDPDLHEAMTLQPSTDTAPGTVLHTVQTGYVLNGRLLRPARVIIAKNPDSAA